MDGMGIVTLRHSSNFHTLRSFITNLTWTWHPVSHPSPAEAADFIFISYSAKDRTATKAVMAGLECAPLWSFRIQGPQQEVHRAYHRNLGETIQSIGQHLSAQLLHLNFLRVHLMDFSLAFHAKDFSCQLNNGNQMVQGFWTCPHCWRFNTTNMLQPITGIIYWTRAV
jgi:hypothetical protein